MNNLINQMMDLESEAIEKSCRRGLSSDPSMAEVLALNSVVELESYIVQGYTIVRHPLGDQKITVRSTGESIRIVVEDL